MFLAQSMEVFFQNIGVSFHFIVDMTIFVCSFIKWDKHNNKMRAHPNQKQKSFTKARQATNQAAETIAIAIIFAVTKQQWPESNASNVEYEEDKSFLIVVIFRGEAKRSEAKNSSLKKLGQERVY